MALFESYERRIDKITEVLNSYGINSIEEAEKLLRMQVLMYMIRLKKFSQSVLKMLAGLIQQVRQSRLKKIAERQQMLQQQLEKDFKLFVFLALQQITVKQVLDMETQERCFWEEETDCFCFLAGHESFAAAEGAIGIAEKANKVRQKPLRVILNGLGKDAAEIIARINGFTFVETEYDPYTNTVKEVFRKSYSDPEGPRGKVNCYGANDVCEGVAIMWKENVDVSITGNSTNPTRFQHPVAGTYKKERIEAGKKYFSVASGGGTGRTLHPDNMAAGPASYGMTDTLGRMHSDAQFAGSSSVPAHVEMMGLIGMGNNPMVGATVAVAVSIEEAAKEGKF